MNKIKVEEKIFPTEADYFLKVVNLGFTIYFKDLRGVCQTRESFERFLYEEIVITIMQDCVDGGCFDLDWDEVTYKAPYFTVDDSIAVDIDQMMEQVFLQNPELKERTYNKYEFLNYLNCYYPFKFIINYD